MTHPLYIDVCTLRTFVTIAQEKSFSKAADILAKSQPTISGHIKKLEDTLGRRLFDRTSRSVNLTLDGLTALSQAYKLLEANDKMTSLFHDSDSEKIVIGASSSYIHEVVDRQIGAFATRYSPFEYSVLKIPSSGIIDFLGGGRLDLAVLWANEIGIHTVRHWDAPIKWVGRELPRFAEGAPVPLVAYPSPDPIKDVMLRALSRSGKIWQVVQTVASDIHDVIATGVAITAMPSFAIRHPINKLSDRSDLPPLTPTRMQLLKSQSSDSFQKRHFHELVNFMRDEVFA